jgi:hypothetical protein
VGAAAQDITRRAAEAGANIQMVETDLLPHLRKLLALSQHLRLLRKMDGALFRSPRKTTVVATKVLALLLLER